MAEQHERLARTIMSTLRGLATEAEIDELRQWLAASPENVRWLNQFTDDEWLGAEISYYHNSNREENRQQLWQLIDAHEQQHNDVKVHQTKRAWRMSYKATAAAVGLGIIGTIWWFSTTRQQATSDVVKRDSAQKEYKDTSMIVLQSADGHKYDMQQNRDSLLTEQGDFALYRKDHRLVITLLPQSKRKQAKGYNKLTITGGGRYQVDLPDGSRVWLNAASSIAIPAVDTGRYRRVSITGEAYFEVTRNTARPFIVQLPDTTITVEVTGTVFNITAYPGETVKTTLIDGSLNVAKGSHKKLIKPGQQAEVSGNDIKVTDEVDTDQVTAWKKGNFDFEDDSLTTVVRELARFYNLEPDYIDSPVIFVSYGYSRDLPVEVTLQQMHAGNPRINLHREGKRLVVRR